MLQVFIRNYLGQWREICVSIAVKLKSGDKIAQVAFFPKWLYHPSHC